MNKYRKNKKGMFFIDNMEGKKMFVFFTYKGFSPKPVVEKK